MITRNIQKRVKIKKVIKTITFSEDNKVNKGIKVTHIEKGTSENIVNINLSFNNEVEINNSGIKIENGNEYKPIYEDITMQFNKKLFIENKDDYALYSKSSASGGKVSASIKIGDENKKISLSK